MKNIYFVYLFSAIAINLTFTSPSYSSGGGGCGNDDDCIYGVLTGGGDDYTMGCDVTTPPVTKGL